jgi:sulfane dehydrogenase subunit SoxC
LFGATAGAAAAAIVSRPALAQEGDNLPPSVPEWQLHAGDETLNLPYGRPSKFEANVVRRYRQGLPEPPTRLSSFSLTPLQHLCGLSPRTACIMSVTTPGFRPSIRRSTG